MLPQLWPQPQGRPKPQEPQFHASLPVLLGRELSRGGGRALPVLPCRGLAGPGELRRGSPCCPKFGECSEPGVWLFRDRVHSQKMQSPSVRLAGGSDPGLPLGPSPAAALPPFPAPAQRSFLCQGWGDNNGASHNSLHVALPPRPFLNRQHLSGERKAQEQPRKQLKAHKGVARTLCASPLLGPAVKMLYSVNTCGFVNRSCVNNMHISAG